MPQIITAQSFSLHEREARKDFIDKHTPYILLQGTPKRGVPFVVRVRIGSEYSHIDEFNHYISTITLYDGNRMLAKVELAACIISDEERRGNADVTFSIVPNKENYSFTAHCYCTKHGLWESEEVNVTVEQS